MALSPYVHVMFPPFLPELPILDVYPGSWFVSIPDPTTAGLKCCPTFFCSNKYNKIENYFIFEVDKKKNRANLQRKAVLLPKIVTKLSKIWVWVWDLRSKIRKKTIFRIPDPGSKRHRIPELYLQQCVLWIFTLQLHARRGSLLPTPTNVTVTKIFAKLYYQFNWKLQLPSLSIYLYIFLHVSQDFNPSIEI